MSEMNAVNQVVIELGGHSFVCDLALDAYTSLRLMPYDIDLIDMADELDPDGEVIQELVNEAIAMLQEDENDED